MGEIDKFTVMVRNFNTCLSNDRTSKQKISKYTVDLNNIISQFDVT